MIVLKINASNTKATTLGGGSMPKASSSVTLWEIGTHFNYMFPDHYQAISYCIPLAQYEALANETLHPTCLR